MKVIAKKVWEEPAVAIGLFASLILLVGGILDGHADWNYNHIIAIAAPLLTSLGIRQAVSPAVGPREEAYAEATTYQTVTSGPVNPATKLPGKTGFEELPPKNKE